MEIKPAEFTVCECCGTRKRKADAVYGCDECQKPINFDAPDREFLNVAVHHQGMSDVQTLHLCSWQCCFAALRKVSTDYFVSLPYLSFDQQHVPGMRPEDFFAELK